MVRRPLPTNSVRWSRPTNPLQIVQMDHTPADLIIVDEYFRRPLCRPTLTLQIDIATRVIPGYYVSLEHPSATSVGMALRHGVLAKAQWLEERAVEMDYPVFGLPEVLHVDNAREFHSRALARGCQQHGINLRYRPKRTPHYGGHIERLIGTTIGKIHLLPGTTYSSVADKGDYDAEGLLTQIVALHGKGAEHLSHQHTLGARGVDRIVDRAEVGTLGTQRVDDLQQVRERARQAIDAHDQQSIPLPYPFKRPSEVRPISAATARLVLEDKRTALRTQRIVLGSGVLLVGRDAGVADQGHLSHFI